MKAKRYMKPPSCRKPATVIVPYAGQALDGQRPHQDNQRAAHLIGESGPKELEGTKGTTSPCPQRTHPVTMNGRTRAASQPVSRMTYSV
jgi:hypothetical protein